MKNLTTAAAKVETLAQRTERVLSTDFSQLGTKDVNFLIEKITKAAPFVIKGINNELACDFVQDALMKYYEKPSAYDATKASFYTFILNSAKNLAIDFHRSAADKTSQKASVKLSETDKDGESIAHSIEKHLKDASADFASTMDASDILKFVKGKMKPEIYTVFELQAEGYNLEEIAETLGMNFNTLRVTILRERNKLGIQKEKKASAKIVKRETFISQKDIKAIEKQLA